MARYAKVSMSVGSYIVHGKGIQITILGEQIDFVASSATYVDGNTRYFLQNPQPNVLSDEIAQNVASFENALKGFLLSIGENRFEVSSEVHTDFMGFQNGGSIVIKAKFYSDELNMPFSVIDDGMFASGTTNDNPQVVTYQKVDATCYGSATGDILVRVVGGIAPYTYHWSDGPTTKDRPMVGDGAYELTVTDSAKPLPLDPNLPPDSPLQTFSEDHPGVVKIVVTIGQPSRIEIQATVQQDDVTVAVSGGTPGYSFAWSDGSTARDRENLEPGNHQLTVTDANGCSSTVTVIVRDFRFYFSRNPVTLTLGAGELEGKPNLSFLCELWVEEEYLSNSFRKVTAQPLEHPADSAGTTVFDVSELLDAFVANYLPPFGLNELQRADGVFKRFYLKYTQKYGDPLIVDPYTQIDTQFIVCGGLDTTESQADTFFTSYLKNRKPFFTWDLPIKEVYRDQPEYLFFMPNSFTLEVFMVMSKIYFADGSTTTIELYSTAGINRFELYCLPVGHDQLELAILKPGIDVNRWEVYVVDQDNAVISETRRYNLLKDFGEKRRYLLYTNSLGGINTLVATGKAKLKLDPDSTTLEKSLLPGTAPTQHQVEVRTKVVKPTLELSTGYRSQKQMIAFQDFIQSGKVWLVENDRYIPVFVPDKNHTPLDEAEDLGYVDFEVQLPRRHSYTPQLRLAGYLVDQTGDRKPMEP